MPTFLISVFSRLSDQIEYASAASDAAVCERLTFIAEREQEQSDALANPLPVEGNVGVHGDGGQAVGVSQDGSSNPWVTSRSGDTAVVGSLALSDDDHHRLDLIWWGVWAAVGMSFVALIAPRFLRAISPERAL